MTDTKKNAMLKKLGITPEQYVQLIKEYPNFPTLSPIEQNDIIDKSIINVNYLTNSVVTFTMFSAERPNCLRRSFAGPE